MGAFLAALGAVLLFILRVIGILLLVVLILLVLLLLCPFCADLCWETSPPSRAKRQRSRWRSSAPCSKVRAL